MGWKISLVALSFVFVSFVLGDSCSPVMIDSYATPNAPLQFTVTPDGTYAFVVMESNKLLVLDISNPSDIKRASLFKVSSGSQNLQSLALSHNGQILYLSSNEGMAVLDVSNPEQPEIQPNVDARIQASQLALTSTEDKLVAITSSNLKILNLTGFSVLDSINCDAKATMTLSSDNSYIYVSDDASGLKVFNKQSKLSLLSRFRSKNGEDSKSSAVSADGKTLYAAFANEGVYVLNIADPKNPKKVRTLTASNGKAKYVSLFEPSLAFVGLGASVGVGVYNLSKSGDVSAFSTLSFNHEDILQTVVHPDSYVSSKKLLVVLTDQRFAIVDFSSCLSNLPPSESTTGPINPPPPPPPQTTSTPPSSSITTGESSGETATTSAISLSGSVSQDDGADDAGSAMVAIAVVGSVAFIGIAIYVSLYIIKRRRWNNFEKEYRSINTIPLEEMNS